MNIRRYFKILAGLGASLILLTLSINPAMAAGMVITRISVDSSGAEENRDAWRSSVSADGRYVAFESYASNLVSGDTNGAGDIFLHDTQTGATTCISADPSGKPGNGESYSENPPSISADGRYVAFSSHSSNLVSGDTNGAEDVFLRDTQTGTTRLVSAASNGSHGNDWSEAPSISADGRYVTFRSYASNLVSGDANDTVDVFRHDMEIDTTTLVSVASDGTQGNNWSDTASISADGRYVAFSSKASNLVSGDINGAEDIFLRDTQTDTTTLVSVSSNGTQANSDSIHPSIFADGRSVAFMSPATNLVDGDTNYAVDIFLHNMDTGATTRLSVDSNGVQGNGWCGYPSISADGRYVAFESAATNLVNGDTNIKDDIFLRDMQNGAIVRLSLDSSGTEGNGMSMRPSISADGHSVAFMSGSDNLISGDTNGYADIFVVSSSSFFSHWIYLPMVIR